ncbi:BrnA antitoxin family protein [Candidatus Saccharibacteria bacterium]|nr:BrnA antitoxin family protein [Candidatus Saccharibacteria bacterium]
MTNVRYTDAPAEIARAIDAAVSVNDFLPSPESFADKIIKEKITLNVDRGSLNLFREYAKKHGLKYQSLMNQVLASYAEKQLQTK